MNGSGTTVIPGGGSLVLSGPNAKGFAQRTINNAGTTSLSGGDLWSGQGATFNNTGTFDVAGDTSFLRSEEHTSELQSLTNLVCRVLTEKNNIGPAFNNNGTLNEQ